jgi:subtilisin-like proprotein convertase family protein
MQDVPRDVHPDGGCDPGTCLRTCVGIGSSGGSCVEGSCSCQTWDGPTDVVFEDGGGDGPPPACDPATCTAACESIGEPGGTCLDTGCHCGLAPDADADAPDDSDDVPPPDDGGPDVPPADDGGVEDVAEEDAGPDDTPVDDGGADDYGSGPWGGAVCNSTGGTLADRPMLIGGPTRLSQTVTLPAVGVGRAVRLEITITGRRVFVAALPFDDIQATLTSPGGVARNFWHHFEGDPPDLLGLYRFYTPWILPVWWDTSLGGSWTLTLQDDEYTGQGTQLVSWCVTPLDPATHAATDTGAALRACDTSSHSISDYLCDSSGANCEHPVTLQLQVLDLVRAAGAPNLSLTTSHPDASQLRIELIGADGSESTVWNRGSGALPASFPLSGMTGDWMTGRYQLTITDLTAGTTGSLSRWCIEAN